MERQKEPNVIEMKMFGITLGNKLCAVVYLFVWLLSIQEVRLLLVCSLNPFNTLRCIYFKATGSIFSI